MFGKSKKPEAAPPPATPPAPEPPPLPPAAARTFEQRQADYAAAEREIAGEHEATLAELTRRRKAGQEHRDKQLLELEARKAEETRAAVVRVNGQARDALAPLFGKLFAQVSNADLLALVEATKHAERHAIEHLGKGLSGQRFAIEAIEAFRPRRLGLVRAALEEDFWLYRISASVLHAATEFMNHALAGNLTGARTAFDALELALYSLPQSEPTADELERWKARCDLDPGVCDRLEADREAKRKADELEASRRHSEAWARKQAADRKARRSPGGRVMGGHAPPDASGVFVP